MKLARIVCCVGLLFCSGARAEAPDLRLWRLDCGTIEVDDLNRFSDAFGYPGRRLRLTDSCYLIQHGATYMLWDLGLPAALRERPMSDGGFHLSLAETLASQLRQIGLRPEQIGLIGVSHYHFDHLGQAADFARAKLMIGEADLKALRAEPAPYGAQPGLAARWLLGNAPVEPVTGDKDVFGDGSVTMLAMPGHTPGSYALLLRLARTGPVLLSGDVVHFEEQLATGNVPPFNTDRAQSLASMDRLRKVAAALKATLVVQHDAADVAKLPAFPASAD